MPDLIVLRLHPVKPVDGADFADYLDNLTITAFDLSTGDPDGQQVGQAQFSPANPMDKRIFQHRGRFLPLGPQRDFSAATAVIELQPPAGHVEYPGPGNALSDLRLDIERNGNQIIDRSLDYNVDMALNVPLPQT